MLPVSSRHAAATPSTLGFYPSTDIYTRGNFHLDVDAYGKGLHTDAFISTGLSYGTGPERNGLFGRSEVGFDYMLSMMGETPMASTGKRLLFNGKTQLYNNDTSHVRLVAGFWGLGDRAIGAPNIGYVLGSKAFSFGRVHLGVAHSFAAEEAIAAPSGHADRTYGQLGFDTMITPKLQCAADFYSGKSFVSALQPTLYYLVNDKASFGVGYARFNDKSMMPSRNQVYVCFDYNFGKGSSMNMVQPMAIPASHGGSSSDMSDMSDMSGMSHEK
jgi:hypothetical protein